MKLRKRGCYYSVSDWSLEAVVFFDNFIDFVVNDFIESLLFELIEVYSDGLQSLLEWELFNSVDNFLFVGDVFFFMGVQFLKVRKEWKGLTFSAFSAIERASGYLRLIYD